MPNLRTKVLIRVHILNTTKTNIVQKWYQSTAYDLQLFRWIFFLFNGPSLFKKHKPVFRGQRHFVFKLSVNVESTANAHGSGALQATITVIAACVVLLSLV
jgi:hypothetical protein